MAWLRCRLLSGCAGCQDEEHSVVVSSLPNVLVAPCVWGWRGGRALAVGGGCVGVGVQCLTGMLGGSALDGGRLLARQANLRWGLLEDEVTAAHWRARADVDSAGISERLAPLSTWAYGRGDVVIRGTLMTAGGVTFIAVVLPLAVTWCSTVVVVGGSVLGVQGLAARAGLRWRFFEKLQDHMEELTEASVEPSGDTAGAPAEGQVRFGDRGAPPVEQPAGRGERFDQAINMGQRDERPLQFRPARAPPPRPRPSFVQMQATAETILWMTIATPLVAGYGVVLGAQCVASQAGAALGAVGPRRAAAPAAVEP